MKNLVTHFLMLFILALSNTAYTQWSTDPNINNPICTTVNDQTYPLIISDGSGGAIIVWTDEHGVNSDIYAQRIDANGIVRWTADGVAICTAVNNQSYPTIISDGSGGAIIAWNDNRSGTNYDIYAQRINGDGIVHWEADGVAVSTAANDQVNPKMVSDGSIGAFIVWQDRRSFYFDIYAQRIDSAGLAQWAIDGVPICTAESTQEFPKIISDGMGGAISTWADKRSHQSSDIYAQRINSNGEVQWTVNGVAICTAPWDQSFIAIAHDGNGGAFITWQDSRSSPVAIYAQRINAGGVVQWIPDGMAISASAYGQNSSAIISDESGGAIVTWQVGPSNNIDIYAQRIDSNGTLQWTASGMAICTAGLYQQEPAIINDENGGVVITWEDMRSGTSYDIYAQRVDENGTIQWATDGVAISTVEDSQIFPTLVGDENGGAIVTWQDSRVLYPNAIDIYAQQLNSAGILGVVTGNIGQQTLARNFVLHQNYPNPFNSQTRISWESPVGCWQTLKVYDVFGKEITTLVDEYNPAGKHETEFIATKLSGGIYFIELRADKFISTKKIILLR